MANKRTPKSEKKQRNIKHIRVGKLDSIEQVAILQARLIKKGVRGAGGVINDVYKLVTSCSMLAKTLEVSDLEKRVDELEKKMAGRL
jgi:predicted ATP-grasp superfamily ATP-dependent carboligase